MDLIEFQGMGEAEQWEEFLDEGIFLAKYEDIDVTQELFRLHGFYVELSYPPLSETQVAMNAFLHGPRYDKYIAADLDYVHTDLEIDFPE